MRSNWRLIWLVPVLCGSMARSEDLAPATVAKILKLVLTDAHETTLACSDPFLKAELLKLGVVTDPESRIVWVKTPQEKAKFRGTDRLTISSQVSDLSAGVIVALVGEGGRSVFYVSKANAQANKISLPTGISKLGKVI